MDNRRLIFAVFCALGMAQCGPTPVGESIGRPFHPSRAGAQVGVQITQVSLNPTNLFVQLLPQQNIDLQQTPLHLLTAYSDINLSNDANLTLTANQNANVTVPQLAALHWTAGEVMVTDPQYIPIGYFAWGNSPENFDTGLGAMALDANIVQPGAYVPVPLADPNVRPTFVNDGNQLGCLDGNQVLAPCGANPNLAVQITALAPVLATNPNGNQPRTYSGSWITLRNNQANPVDIYGLQLCRNGVCTMLDPNSANNPNTLLPASGSAQYWVGQTPDPNSVDALALPPTGSGTVYPPYITTSEELALAPPGPVPNPNTPTVLWSYVRTAVNASTAFASQAIAQQLWDATNDVPNVALPPSTPGQSLTLNPNQFDILPVSATNWAVVD